MNTPYTPISCDFYDELETLALHHTPVLIEGYRPEQANESAPFQLSGTIRTFQTNAQKEEYMIMESGESIRLDWIHSINGRDVSSWTGCRITASQP